MNTNDYGTASCPDLQAHVEHVWDEEHIGSWRCPGHDGSIQLGDRFWFRSISYPPPGVPISQHKLAFEVVEYLRGGTFEVEFIDVDDHPNVKVGTTYFYDYNELKDMKRIEP